MSGPNLRLKLIYLTIENFEMLQQALHKYAKRAEQLVGCILNQLQNARSNVTKALRDDDPKFGEKPTDLIALRRASL